MPNRLLFNSNNFQTETLPNYPKGRPGRTTRLDNLYSCSKSGIKINFQFARIANTKSVELLIIRGSNFIEFLQIIRMG